MVLNQASTSRQSWRAICENLASAGLLAAELAGGQEGACHLQLPLCCASSLSRVQLFATPWTVARQAPLSMGFSRQEYWSGLLCPPPGDLPDPGIKPRSPALQVDSLPTESPGKPFHWHSLNDQWPPQPKCAQAITVKSLGLSYPCQTGRQGLTYLFPITH